MSFLENRFPALAAAIGDDYRVYAADKAKCRCPNYMRHKRGDQHFSLLVKIGDKTGGIVMKCRSGCTNEEILSATGLKWRDLCAGAPRNGNYIVPTVTKTYDYHDPDGNVVLQVARYHPKAFKPRRRLSMCGEHWVYNINGGIVKRVHDHNEPLSYKWIDAGKPPGSEIDRGEIAIPAWFQWPYNAHILANTDRLILWHEGEGCADCTSEMGFVSTCTQGGSSGATFKREWLKLFRDKHVVMLPDHDDAGAKYARYYAGCLMEARAASVTFLRLPGLADKGDVKDWAFKVRKNPEDVGPNSTPARGLRNLIAKATGYGRAELKKLFEGS